MTNPPHDPPGPEEWPPPDGPDAQPPSPWAGQSAAPPSPWVGAPPLAPAPGPQSKKPIAIGILISFASLVVSSLATRLVGSSDVFGAVASLAWITPLVGLGMLFHPRTRRIGLGVLLGFGIMLVIGFAACVALIALYASGPG